MATSKRKRQYSDTDSEESGTQRSVPISGVMELSEVRSRSLHIGFINCRGLENKLDKSDDMKRFISSCDFVGLNEPNIRNLGIGSEPLPDHPVQGYTLFCEPNSTCKDERGGIDLAMAGLLVRNDLKQFCRRLPVSGLDSVCFQITADVYGFDFVLAVQYMHNHRWSQCTAHGLGAREKSKRNREAKLKRFIYEIYDPKPQRLLVLGDFNANIYDPKPQRLLVLGDFNAFVYSYDAQLSCCNDKTKIKNTTPLQMLNLHPRFGERGSGQTCHQTAVASKQRIIDIAFASDSLFELIKDFEVQPFSENLSDVHSALRIELSSSERLPDQEPISINESMLKRLVSDDSPPPAEGDSTSNRREVLASLRKDVRDVLENLNDGLRSSLEQGFSDIPRAIRLLQDLISLPVTPELLLEKPDILEALEKIKQYKYNSEVKQLAQDIFKRYQDFIGQNK